MTASLQLIPPVAGHTDRTTPTAPAVGDEVGESGGFAAAFDASRTREQAGEQTPSGGTGTNPGAEDSTQPEGEVTDAPVSPRDVAVARRDDVGNVTAPVLVSAQPAASGADPLLAVVAGTPALAAAASADATAPDLNGRGGEPPNAGPRSGTPQADVSQVPPSPGTPQSPVQALDVREMVGDVQSRARDAEGARGAARIAPPATHIPVPDSTVAAAPAAQAPTHQVTDAPVPKTQTYLQTGASAKTDQTPVSTDRTFAPTGSPGVAASGLPQAGSGAEKAAPTSAHLAPSAEPGHKPSGATDRPGVAPPQPDPTTPDQRLQTNATTASAPSRPPGPGDTLGATSASPAGQAGHPGPATQDVDPAPQPAGRRADNPQSATGSSPAAQVVSAAVPPDAAQLTAEGTADPFLSEVRVADAPTGDRATLPRLDPALLARPEVARAVTAQITDMIRAGADGSVEVTLRPEELGRVSLSLTGDGGAMTVSVAAERAETLDLLRRNIALLERELTELGYSELTFNFGAASQDGTDRDPSSDAQTPSSTDVSDAGTATAPTQPSARTTTGSIDLRL